MSDRRGQFGEVLTQAEQIAEAFHEHYERLAPAMGYRTREASAKPWKDVPDANRLLMIATVEALIEEGPIPADEALRILLSEVEHTADLAEEDGSKVTASKLRAHLLQFAEATEEVPS